MSRWDYKVLTNDDTCSWYDENGIKVCVISELCNYLNTLGDDRWELVHFKSKSGGGSMILKRER